MNVDYVATAERVCALLEQADDPQLPIVREALELAARPWSDVEPSTADPWRWGWFATSVEAVIASNWSQPATSQIVAPVKPGVATDAAAVRLVEAAASVFERASEIAAAEHGWQYAASAAQLREAAHALAPQVVEDPP